MIARMVIGECLSEDQLREFRSIFKEHHVSELRQEPGFDRLDFMAEEGGSMVVITTFWKTREACLRHHSSRPYRQFVARTQHLLAGNFVVKLFRLD